jgi:hypothetical protein
MVSFQSRAMIEPALVITPNDPWVVKLQPDIREVIRECGARQTFYILEDKGLRLRLPDHPDRLGPHVSMIGMGAMLPTKGKWLARGPAAD